MFKNMTCVSGFVLAAVILCGTACKNPSSPAKSTIIKVSINPTSAELEKGKTQSFTATVTVSGGASKLVNWTVSGNNSSQTIVSPGGESNKNGLLSVAADETAKAVTVTVTSAIDESQYASATVTIKDSSVPEPDTNTVTVGLVITDTGGVLALSSSTGNLTPVIYKNDSPGSVTFTLAPTAPSGTVSWYVDDAPAAIASGSSATFNAAAYEIGYHSVQLSITINSVPWSAATPTGFTVQ
ncbi:MAG: hypothetical protein FWF29_05685 [Treponema sp.]|nr:hypothetical protein [Treponema sp.]